MFGGLRGGAILLAVARVVLILKLLVPAAAFAILWLQVNLDYKKPWSDRRRTLHRRAFCVVNYVLVPLAALGTLTIVYVDHRDSSSMQRTIQRVAELLEVSADSQVLPTLERLLGTVDQKRARLDDQQAQLQALKDASAPRVLSPTQRRVLVERLKTSGPHAVTLRTLVSDAEAARYGEALRAAFVEAGWSVEALPSIFSPPVVGLLIKAPAARVPRSHTTVALRDALRAAKVELPERYLEVDTALPPSAAELLVGERPTQ